MRLEIQGGVSFELLGCPTRARVKAHLISLDTSTLL